MATLKLAQMHQMVTLMHAMETIIAVLQEVLVNTLIHF